MHFPIFQSTPANEPRLSFPSANVSGVGLSAWHAAPAHASTPCVMSFPCPFLGTTAHPEVRQGGVTTEGDEREPPTTAEATRDSRTDARPPDRIASEIPPDCVDGVVRTWWVCRVQTSPQPPTIIDPRAGPAEEEGR